METGLVLREAEVLMPVMSIETATDRYRTIVEYVGKLMSEGTDFGKIPGTDKNTLLKPGAEKLCTLFGLSKHFSLIERIEDWNGSTYGEPFFNYIYRCGLYRGEVLIAEADGSCNSRETKYRWRKAERTCPECGTPAIIKGRAEYGGGWLCFGKKGGCGAKFGDLDEQIVNQEVGRIANPDIADQVNTMQKMAQKRALIAATLLAVNASEFFTQDMEDFSDQLQSMQGSENGAGTHVHASGAANGEGNRDSGLLGMERKPQSQERLRGSAPSHESEGLRASSDVRPSEGSDSSGPSGDAQLRQSTVRESKSSLHRDTSGEPQRRPSEGSPATMGVICPKCQGPVWDNRESKRNPKAPDYKCKNKQCDGAIWLNSHAETERKVVLQSIVDACRLLNEHNDETTWSAKTLDAFAIEQFDTKTDDLNNAQLNQLLKTLSDRFDGLKAAEKADKERQALVDRIEKDAPHKEIRAELKKNFQNRTIYELNVEELGKLQQAVIAY